MDFSTIKTLCKERNITIPQLAEKIQVSEPGLYQMIRSESIKVDILEKIANTLNVPIWYFFDLDPETPYIKDIEEQKNLNKINESTLKQMEGVINELKRRLENIKTTCNLFIAFRELYIQTHMVDESTYENIVRLLLNFLVSDNEDCGNGSDKMIRIIMAFYHTKNKADSIVVKREKAKSKK